jgi:type II secretory ATPase GspE/PulE/Tfp pilus assembly ATPase PilB-like protein
MRLLKDTSENFSLEMLGFSESDRTKLLKAIRSPNGMILATGPTGSGKTTTLYTLLKLLNRPEVSIVTLEDPIEYAVADIEQIQVNPRTGLTFANGLRSILRQDPDIIMVGEIRDAETASIAVNTALTGHLLLSTLHTNDAATTLPRLAEMGVEPYLVATTVAVAIGQRLVRRVCDHCKEEVALSDTEQRAIESLSTSYTLERIVRGAGCDECLMSGFKGRLCLNEVLVADNDIKDAILKNASSSEIARIAIKNGMSTMLDDGFDKVRQGLTTVSEVLRVVHD